MFSVFLNVMLPIFVMASLGIILSRWKKVTAGQISQATLYILAPCLIFNSLYKSNVPALDSYRMLAFVVLFSGTLFVVCWVIARLSKFDRGMESAFMISSMFMNSGNSGLPIALLAFGEEGLSRAAVFFTAQAALGGSWGVYLASRSHSSGLAPLKEVFKMPTVYAALAAVVVKFFNVPLPLFVSKPIDLMGGAAIPCMLLVLGIQLATGQALENVRAVATATVVRLVLSVGIAFLGTMLLGITGVTQQVVIVLAAMPTAVFTTILATEFDANPRFVTNVVVVTSGASIITLTVLITALKTFLT